MLFRKTSDSSEAMILTGIGMGIALCTALVGTVAFANPFGAKNNDQLTMSIESPYIGQGVTNGTALVLHGVQVGVVTEVRSLRDGGVRLVAELDRGPTADLTDTMGIDFRPANYFGVTGINLRPGDGGDSLTNGSTIKTEPAGNFTLQALLSRLGEISHGALTPHLVDVIERTTTYIDGLDPLLETMLVVSNSLANVQTVSTAQLLTNATGISVAFPSFVNSTVTFGDNFSRAGFQDLTEDFWQTSLKPSADLIATSLFNSMGDLVGKQSTNLAPLTDMIKVLTDIGPGLVPAESIDSTATALRSRLEQLFSGPPDRRAVNVRVILDSLPGVASPIEAFGGIPQ